MVKNFENMGKIIQELINNTKAAYLKKINFYKVKGTEVEELGELATTLTPQKFDELAKLET